MKEPVVSDNLSPEAAHATREAIHAAKNAAQAIETARALQMEGLGDMVQQRFEDVLARGTEQEKTLILARVPYICQDIKDINKKFDVILAKMEKTEKDLNEKNEKNAEKYMTQEQFAPYKWVLGIVGSVIIAGIAVAVLGTILIK